MQYFDINIESKGKRQQAPFLGVTAQKRSLINGWHLTK